MKLSSTSRESVSATYLQGARASMAYFGNVRHSTLLQGPHKKYPGSRLLSNACVGLTMRSRGARAGGGGLAGNSLPPTKASSGDQVVIKCVS